MLHQEHAFAVVDGGTMLVDVAEFSADRVCDYAVNFAVIAEVFYADVRTHFDYVKARVDVEIAAIAPDVRTQM